MKKSLKLISLLLTLVMVLSLGACGGQKDPSASEQKQGSEAPVQSTAAPTQEQPASSGTSQLAGTYDIKVWCPDAAVDLTKQQIEAYNKANTDGIVINATVEAVGEGDAATSMITDVEAGGERPVLLCAGPDRPSDRSRRSCQARQSRCCERAGK